MILWLATHVAIITTALPTLLEQTKTETDVEEIHAKLLAWVPMHESAQVFDAECRPLQARRKGTTLLLSAITKDVVQGSERIVVRVHYKVTLSLYDTGATTTKYTRSDGGWIEDGQGGLGTWRRLSQVISRVENDAAWFNLTPVEPIIRCQQRHGCVATEGKTSCATWVLELVNEDSSFPGPYVVGTVTSQTPCDAPTQPPPPSELAEVAARIGTQPIYFQLEPTSPALYRTKDACHSHKSQRRD